MTGVAPIHSFVNQNQQAGGLGNAVKELKEAIENGEKLTKAQQALKNRMDAAAAFNKSNGATLDVYNKAGEVVGQQTYKLGTLGETAKNLSKTAKIGIGAAIAAVLGIGGYFIKTKVIDKKAQEAQQPQKLDAAA